MYPKKGSGCTLRGVPSRLVIMGSGETAPTSIKLHRELIAGAHTPVMLDTPYGFQANADDLNAKIAEYFADSVGTPVSVASWRRAEEPLVDRERTLSQLARSSYAFAGPGSPSYALRQWINTPVPDALADIVNRGGTIVMGSAAAVTLGAHAIPVYEIYKVGLEPHWLTGLDLLGQLTGIEAAVIPHFDNREGGRHDTRFCYLGQTRLEAMEGALPDDAGVLGVDEHTAVVFDLDSGVARVHGAGGLTLRMNGASQVIGAGNELAITDIASVFSATANLTAATVADAGELARITTAVPTEPGDHAPSLAGEARVARNRFDECLARADADGALHACLELEEAIHAWSADTWQSDDIDVARRTLRSMLVDLAGAATEGLTDPRTAIEPLVSIALSTRDHARRNKDFATSDSIRDQLAAAGIEIRDTPEGQEWELR
jgi:hypothetical protein